MSQFKVGDREFRKIKGMPYRLRALLAECQAVLEFYGDEGNWSFARSERGAISGHIYEYWEMDAGPAKAREMLEKLKEELK